MRDRIKAVREGYRTVTPELIIDGAGDAIEFYKKAFDAIQVSRIDRQDGKVMHAVIRIGDSLLMIVDECKSHEGHEEKCARSPASVKGTTVNFYLYVKDVDEVFRRAIENGAKEVMPVTDMFWGDRIGMLRDPAGHFWSVATQKERIAPEQMKTRVAEFCQKNPDKC